MASNALPTCYPKTTPTVDPASICNPKHHNATYNPDAADNPTSEPTIVPTSSCDPMAPSEHLLNKITTYRITPDPTVCHTC